MSACDYIRIVGLESDPAEVFQGISGMSASEGGDASANVVIGDIIQTPISEDEENSGAIWAAQNTLIQEESAYLDEIKTMLEDKTSKLPREESLKDSLLDEFLEYVAGKAAYLLTLYATKNTVWAGIAEFLVEGLVGVGLESLRNVYTRGNALCDVLKAENTALLALEISRENYELRQSALAVHTEIIENLLHHIAILEQEIQDIMNADSGEILDALKALQYNDEFLELSDGTRVHLAGKIIEYGE